MIGPGTTLKGVKSGRQHRLGTAIARGGEGVVFELQGDPSRVAKIYARPVDRNRAEKLSALISRASPQLSTVSAWPEEMVADATAKPVGFVMPAVSGKPLHLFITPSDRQRTAPHLGYAHLVGIAANLARAVTNFHHAQVVLSDINFSNFLVLADGTVRVIDCDSVQIGNHARFRATVAMEEFIPPELQGKRVADHARTQDHDVFGLSVLIFLLLVQGRHPFAGNDGMPIGQAISQRLHPFRSHGSRKCPLCIMGIGGRDILSPDLIGLFRASFSGGRMFSSYRPTADGWRSALEAFSRSLVACKSNVAHAYAPGATSCPWCRLEAKGLPALFQPTARSRLPAPPRRRSALGRLLFGT